MSEVLTSTILCPHCEKEITIERPAAQRRGQLAGVALDAMTDEQLKVEIINAKSVLYKAEKRGAAAETIAKNQARVDAAMAEKAKRTPVTEAVEKATEETVTEEVVNEEVAAEI